MTKQHIPTIRFQGFNDEWEDEEIKNLIVKGGSGGTPKSTEKSFYNGDIPFLSITDISNSDGYILYTEKSITKLGLESSSAWIVPKGSISLAMYASVGKVGVLGNDMATSQAFYNMVFENNLLRDFIYQRLLRANGLGEWVKLVSTGTQGNLNAEKVKGFKISLPSLPEQESIGQIFRTLDDLISAYKDNLEHYQSLKTSMLSKMFPKEGQKQPEIRLDGFDGDWEEIELKNFSEKNKEKNKNNEYSETLTNSAEFGIINQREFFDKDISNQKNLNMYYIVRNNDFVYNPRISNFAPVGPIKRNKLNKTGVMSPLYYIFRVVRDDIVNLNYLETYYSTTLWYKFMKINGDSGVRSDRFSIKDSIFATMPIPLPSLPEQEAIGAFFANLDETISSYKDKIGQLELLKKNFLSQMFI